MAEYRLLGHRVPAFVALSWLFVMFLGTGAIGLFGLMRDGPALVCGIVVGALVANIRVKFR